MSDGDRGPGGGRGDVWLADLVRSIDRLQPDDEAAAAIVKLLGFDAYLTFARARPRGAHHPDLPTAPDTLPAAPAAVAEHRDEAVEPADAGPIVLATARTVAGPSDDVAPSWLRDPGVEPIMAAAEQQAVPRPAYEPLFVPLQQRAILMATLATRAHEGDIDAARLVRLRSEMRPIERLLRLPSRTLRRGVQLLLDHSEGFVPYATDREEIAGAIEKVVGTSLLKVLRFTGSPERGVFPPRSDEVPWLPPAQGTLIACVSDFGVGGPRVSTDRAGIAEWIRFARRAEAAGCPVAGFIPFGPRHWPPALASVVRLVHWDRGTSVRAVFRAFGRGHRVGV